MDKKLNEDIDEPLDAGMAGVGQNRPRDTQGMHRPHEAERAAERDERADIEDMAAPLRPGAERPAGKGSDEPKMR